jgi:hypothetical protein
VLDNGQPAVADVVAADNDDLYGTTDEFAVTIRSGSRVICDKRGTLALGNIDEPTYP